MMLRPTLGPEGGAGLGLAVVRMLVEQSGGTIFHGPTDGGRAEFLVTLPRYDLLDYLE
jgi:signal transduction histidine kinase